MNKELFFEKPGEIEIEQKRKPKLLKKRLKYKSLDNLGPCYDGCEKYYYDKQKRLIKFVETDSDNKKTVLKYYYSKENPDLLISVRLTGKVNLLTTFQYNDQKQLVKEETFSADNLDNPLSTTRFSYENGLLKYKLYTSYKQNEGIFQVDEKLFYEYDYDEQGRESEVRWFQDKEPTLYQKKINYQNNREYIYSYVSGELVGSSVVAKNDNGDIVLVQPIGERPFPVFSYVCKY